MKFPVTLKHYEEAKANAFGPDNDEYACNCLLSVAARDAGLDVKGVGIVASPGISYRVQLDYGVLHPNRFSLVLDQTGQRLAKLYDDLCLERKETEQELLAMLPAEVEILGYE